MRGLHFLGILIFLLLAVGQLVAQSEVQEEQITDVVFKGKPFYKADNQGNFTECGFVVNASGVLRNSQERWGLWILVSQGKDSVNYFVRAVTTKAKSADTLSGQWVPEHNLINWVRINNLPPIVADWETRESLLDQGESDFVTRPTKNVDWISPVFDKKTVLSAQIAYPYIHTTRTFSGILEMSEISSAQIKQCLQAIR